MMRLNDTGINECKISLIKRVNDKKYMFTANILIWQAFDDLCNGVGDRCTGYKC